VLLPDPRRPSLAAPPADGRPRVADAYEGFDLVLGAAGRLRALVYREEVDGRCALLVARISAAGIEADAELIARWAANGVAMGAPPALLPRAGREAIVERFGALSETARAPFRVERFEARERATCDGVLRLEVERDREHLYPVYRLAQVIGGGERVGLPLSSVGEIADFGVAYEGPGVI
jgi:hypothetical protein